jgi:hypothetical protein
MNDSNYYSVPSAAWAVWRSRACHGRASREMGCRDERQGYGEESGGRELYGMLARPRKTVDRRIAGRTDRLILGVQSRARNQFSDAGSRPGGGFAILTRWRRILSTCGGSVMTASTLMGWPQREQVRGSTL